MKTTVMLTKQNYKNLTELASRLAISKSAALRLLISNVVKNKIKLKQTKNKKEVRFTFVYSQDFRDLKNLRKEHKDLNITDLLNNVISTSYKSFKIFS